MKAVILAAGEGKRMMPLTRELPKPLIPLLGRPLLEHMLTELPEVIDEVILVVGYRGNQIKAHFGTEFEGRKITFVEQQGRGGTACALSLCRDLLGEERFLTLYADDLHHRDDLEELLEHSLSVLVKENPTPEKFGVVSVDEQHTVLSIVEKPSHPLSNLVLTGPALLDTQIFSHMPKPHENGEQYLAEAIALLAQKAKVKAVQASFWMPIGYPEDLVLAEEILAARS